MKRTRKDQPLLFDAVDCPLFQEQAIDGSLGEDDGRCWIGSRCTIGGEGSLTVSVRAPSPTSNRCRSTWNRFTWNGTKSAKHSSAPTECLTFRLSITRDAPPWPMASHASLYAWPATLALTHHTGRRR